MQVTIEIEKPENSDDWSVRVINGESRVFFNVDVPPSLVEDIVLQAASIAATSIGVPPSDACNGMGRGLVPRKQAGFGGEFVEPFIEAADRLSRREKPEKPE